MMMRVVIIMVFVVLSSVVGVIFVMMFRSSCRPALAPRETSAEGRHDVHEALVLSSGVPISTMSTPPAEEDAPAEARDAAVIAQREVAVGDVTGTTNGTRSNVAAGAVRRRA